ncbi:MAG: hypothetical protein A2X48_22845 [Lentisphaerae bacterium GWF2_49_21]|nr:MAG: hypothetical protein A2X48_22845 [Lentisphaerae bacterium GWF2_49_21]
MDRIKQIFELADIARKDGGKYPRKREIYASISNVKGRHFTGVVGPRGAGKTIILKQISHEIPSSIYLSADSIEDIDLFETAKLLSEKYDIGLLLIDEIHFLGNYQSSLKKIYDFLKIKIIFTSSVSLSLYESVHDLSRRVNLVTIFPFTFGEYVFFTKDEKLESLSIDQIYNDRWSPQHLRYGYLFEDYIKGGILPYSLEEPDVLPLLRNNLEKIIHKDIPTVSRLTMDELHLIEKALKFIGRSPTDGINCSSVAKNLGITKYKAESYLKLLEKAFVINMIFPEGTNVLKEPKVLMCLPYRLLYSEYEDCIGALREDFFVESMRMRNLEFSYLKTNRGAKTPDYLVSENERKTVVEVGGNSKGHEQFKSVSWTRRMILVHSGTFSGIRKPLFSVGYA